MKKYVSAIITAFFIVLSMGIMAQENPWKPIARGQSSKGQWLVERHKEIADLKQVSFYSRDNILMYKEEVKSTKINVNRERVIKQLERLLNTIAVEWEKSKAIVSHQLVQDHFN